MDTLEEYVVRQIDEITVKKHDLALSRKDHTETSYNLLMTRYNGQIDILYKCLTAHDNKYKDK